MRAPALVLEGCYNNTPQTGSLTTAENYFLTLLEAKTLKSSCQQGHASLTLTEENPSLVLSSFWWWLYKSLAFLELQLQHSNLCLCFHRVFFLCFSHLIRTPSCWINSSLYFRMTSSSLIISIKTLFLNKISF